MRNRIVVVLTLTLLFAIVPASAKELSFEYDYPVVSDRWGITLGGFLVDLDTTVAVGFGRILGSVINVEDLLNLEESQRVVRLEAFVRLTNRSALEFGLLQVNRSASATVQNPLGFDEFEFVGNIDSTFDIAQFKTILYKYSFINNGRVNAGLSTGLSWFQLDASLAGNAALLDDMGNPGLTASFNTVGERVLAPVPSIGMFVQYAAAKWFIVTLEGQFFDLEIGDFDFRFSDTRVLMDFYFTRHVGLGIGLNTTALEYRQTGDDPLRVDFRFGGILFHVGIAF